MNKEVSILITAIDRPELHTRVLKDYLSYIGDVKCDWHITINNVVGQVNETKKNFETILEGHDLKIFTYETGGTRVDWFTSVQQCIKSAYKSKPSKAYIWLEDDWGKVGSTGSLKKDLELLEHEETYISLRSRNVVSFNPGIWGTKIFETLMYNNIIDPKNSIRGERYWSADNPMGSNPERICCPDPQATTYVKTFKSIYRFEDIGRNWQTTQLKNKRSFNYHE